MTVLDPIIYDVYTDMPPEQLNQVGMTVFRLWAEFALGSTSLGGRRIMYPTGRYRASLSYRRTGVARVAIMADERLAPEAHILETGHAAVDLLTKLRPGTTYPMHRRPRFAAWAGGSRRRKIWAQARTASFTGFATTPTDPSKRGPLNTSGTGPAWTIPAMEPYAPARLLAELIALKGGMSLL